MVTASTSRSTAEAVGPGERRRFTTRFRNSEATASSRTGPSANCASSRGLIATAIVACRTACSSSRLGCRDQLVQTYDAGVTVDQWATLLPGCATRALSTNAVEDCAHGWSLRITAYRAETIHR